MDRIFPAEHPYSSHMSRFAMFPSFTQTRDDYKTGTQAQQQRPLHPQIPANPNEATIHHKSNGNGQKKKNLCTVFKIIMHYIIINYTCNNLILYYDEPIMAFIFMKL